MRKHLSDISILSSNTDRKLSIGEKEFKDF